MSDESYKHLPKSDALLFQFQKALAENPLPTGKASLIMESLNTRKKGNLELVTHTNHIHNDSHTDHSESRPYHDKTGYGF